MLCWILFILGDSVFRVSESRGAREKAWDFKLQHRGQGHSRSWGAYCQQGMFQSRPQWLYKNIQTTTRHWRSKRNTFDIFHDCNRVHLVFSLHQRIFNKNPLLNKELMLLSLVQRSETEREKNIHKFTVVFCITLYVLCWCVLLTKYKIYTSSLFYE